MQSWPVQRNCEAFYGAVPKISKMLVKVDVPWQLTFEGKPVSGIMIHPKCADSLRRILAAIWKRLGKSQAEIDRVGMSKFAGSYNPRKIAGSDTWSMHAYGCAVDFDSANNWLGDTTPAMDRRVVEEFEREGWEWGGHWSRPDGMHFQAAWTRVNPPRLGSLTVVTKATTKQMVQVSKKASFLDTVRKWFTAFGTAVGTTAASVFSLDTLGLVQGWSGIIQGLGVAAAVIILGVIGFWFVTRVLLKMMADDHDEGRWVPSGAGTPEPEKTDAVVSEPVPVA